MQLFDRNGLHHYNWAKRFEGMWTQVTLSYNSEEKKAYFFINDELISQMNGVKQNIPFPINSDLKTHDSIKPFLLGFCSHTNSRYKGKISDFKIYDKFFNTVDEMSKNTKNLVIDGNFSNIANVNQNVIFTEEDIEIVENIVPYRREGRFYCLPHIDEGFVNGRWAKGDTTARNEKRFVTEMQQGKIDYNNDGLNNLKFDLVNVEQYQNNCMIINVKIK
jgi:hypothetical protein